jgi:hypothetical protein
MRWLSKRATILVPVLVLGLALLGLACADSYAALVIIESPAEGASVQSPVELQMSANGTGIGTPDTGNRHFHVYVDGSSDYEIVYETSTTLDLSPGQHTIEVVLAEPNHEETSSRASVTVEVTGGEAAPSTPYPGDFGYG